MDYAQFFAFSGGVSHTQGREFMAAPPAAPRATQTADRGSIFDPSFFRVRDTRAPAPFALQVARRNFEDWLNALAGQWERETGHLASLSRRKQHPAYHKIVQLGQPAVPLLLERLTTDPDFLFPALRDITGENPVPDEARGYYDQMVVAWQEWGRQRGFI
jgi:hypothetical protein